MKENIDFSICEFIEYEMCFFTYTDFCNNRNTIKNMFQKLSYHERLFYRWYVYANIHMQIRFKNAIWDYLNGYDENGFELLRLEKTYKPF